MAISKMKAISYVSSPGTPLANCLKQTAVFWLAIVPVHLRVYLHLIPLNNVATQNY